MDMDGFVESWTALKKSAQDRSAGFNGFERSESGGGMADFKLSYDPYEAKWTCRISWSDRKEVSREGFDETTAVKSCLGSLLHPDFKKYLTSDREGAFPSLEELSRDADSNVRSSVAMKSKLSVEMYERLARDPDSGVRLVIANNKATPQSALRLLVEDEWPKIALIAKTRLEKKKAAHENV